jgi:acetylornithine deacetylase/succinyl-diaminopimelate desuccinylase family protein
VLEGNSAAEKVVQRIEGDRDFVIELAQDLVRIPSVNPKFQVGEGINREADVQRLVASHLEAVGMTTDSYDVFPERPNVYGYRGGTAENSLIINGHVDVVPAGDTSAWSVDPFAAEMGDGKIYGRGAYDMKSGVAAATAAAKGLHDCGIELKGRFEIHSVVDEESGGFGTKDLVKRGRLASAAIIAEPTEGQIMTSGGGLEWVRVTIRGRSAHAGWYYNDIYPQPPKPDRRESGVNAAELAARFVLAVGQLERDWGYRKPAHPLLPPGINTINPGVVQVGSGLGDDGLPTIMGNPAMTPDVAVVDFDFKFLPTETSQQVRKEFEEFVHHWSMQDTWLREHPPIVEWDLAGLHFPPFDTPADHPLVEAVERQRTALDKTAEVTGFVAVCDGVHYSGAGVTPLIYGPSGAGAHGADEWVEVESIVDTAKVFAAAAIDYCDLA